MIARWPIAAREWPPSSGANTGRQAGSILAATLPVAGRLRDPTGTHDARRHATRAVGTHVGAAVIEAAAAVLPIAQQIDAATAVQRLRTRAEALPTITGEPGGATATTTPAAIVAADLAVTGRRAARWR